MTMRPEDLMNKRVLITVTGERRPVTAVVRDPDVNVGGLYQVSAVLVQIDVTGEYRYYPRAALRLVQ